MAEQTEKLAEETNLLDPKVVFDPTKEKTTIITTWQSNDVDDPENAGSSVNIKQEADMTRVNGVLFPLIMIDTQLVQQQYIKSFNLYYTGFNPELTITIENYPELVANTPGMVNKITVIMVPPVDGTYKKISVDFYITSRNNIGNSVKYICSYFYPALEKKYTKIIKTESNNKLNTYDLLYTIAAECKLGFAATDMCKDIPDTKVRLARNQNYKETISEHIKFGGIDENSIFDSWIDVYGFLVLVNIGWIFNSTVMSNELSMKALIGTNVLDGNTKEETISYSTENVMRTFTNWKMTGQQTHNKIANYKWVIDNMQIKTNGTDNKYFYLDHLVNGTGTNGINTKEIKIEDKSTDGQLFKDAYTFQINKYLGAEMGSTVDGNTPVLIQEYIRNAFFAQNKSKILKIELEELNYSIERGMLINIMVYEFDRSKKQQLLLNTSNLAKDGNTDVILDIEVMDSEQTKIMLEDDSLGVPNLDVSGIYYVNGIEYTYNGGAKINQILYLIKHSGTRNSYLNHASMPKIKEIDDN